MTTDASRGVRSALRWCLVGYLVFVVYGSLVPLNFHPLPVAEAWSRFLQTPLLVLGTASRADLVANLLLFVPLAFLVRMVVVAPGQRYAWLADVALWILATLLAAGIEFTQLYFPGRTVSLNDPLAESAGALLGLLAHRRFGTPVRQWFKAWWGTEAGLPLGTKLLRGYLAGLVIFALMPLDLVLSPVELVRKFAEGRVFLLPFSDLHTGWAEALYETGTDVLIWLPVGFLWRLDGLGRSRIVLYGLIAAGAVELAQLFVLSRVSSTTDVLTGALGCGLGGCLPRPSLMAASRRDAHPGERSKHSGMVWFAILFCIWALLMLVLFWYPFEVRTDAAWLRQRMQAAWRVPFDAYYQGSEFHALNELLRKTLFFMPGGLLWAGLMHRRAQADARGQWTGPPAALWHFSGLAAMAAVAATVELGQLFLVDKLADLTDFAIETLGAASGMWLGLRLGRRDLASAALPEVDAAAHQPASTSPAMPATLAPSAARTCGPERAVAPALLWPYLLATATMLGYVLIAGWRIAANDPANHLLIWPVVWVAIGSALLFAVRRPLLGMAAFFGCQFITPRYGPEMAMLLALQALPAMAVLAAAAVWISRRTQARRTVVELLPDGLFLLFFAWVALLTWQGWGSEGHRAIEPLYHPVNYLCCALAYWIARNDTSARSEKRLLAASVSGCVLIAGLMHLAGHGFHLNGHIGFLLALGLPLVHGLGGSAARRPEQLAWWSMGLALALLIVLNQNRSAFAAMVAFALFAAPWPRRFVGVLMTIAGTAGLLVVLWRLGFLDRFASAIDSSLAIRIDMQAQSTVQSRLDLWRASWGIFEAHPVTGVGPGQYELFLARHASGVDKVPAHNSWLTLLIETGAVGVGLATLAFLSAMLMLPLRRLPPGLSGGKPAFAVERTAELGLVVCAVFGLFNSRADFAWAYFLAGWAIPAQLRQTAPEPGASTAGSAPSSAARSSHDSVPMARNRHDPAFEGVVPK